MAEDVTERAPINAHGYLEQRIMGHVMNPYMVGREEQLKELVPEVWNENTKGLAKYGVDVRGLETMGYSPFIGPQGSLLLAMKADGGEGYLLVRKIVSNPNDPENNIRHIVERGKVMPDAWLEWEGGPSASEYNGDGYWVLVDQSNPQTPRQSFRVMNSRGFGPNNVEVSARYPLFLGKSRGENFSDPYYWSKYFGEGDNILMANNAYLPNRQEALVFYDSIFESSASSGGDFWVVSDTSDPRGPHQDFLAMTSEGKRPSSVEISGEYPHDIGFRGKKITNPYWRFGADVIMADDKYRPEGPAVSKFYHGGIEKIL